MKTKVVGVTFKNEKYRVNRQSIIKKLKGMEQVTLRREPKNRFDKNAVAVFVFIGDQRYQIGYLKAELAGIVSDMWKEYKFVARIYEIVYGDDLAGVPWGIVLEVTKHRMERGKKNDRASKKDLGRIRQRKGDYYKKFK